MDALSRLKAMNRGIRRRDSDLHRELSAREDSEVPRLEGLGDELELESIVLRSGRPVLAVKRDRAELVLDDPDTQTWSARLTAASSHLTRAARSVGRIEVEGHSLGWVGTGWLIGADTVVTNRHVATEFGRANGGTFTFRQGLSGSAMVASIDLLEEIDREESLAFALTEILHIEDTDGPDLAFLRVEQIGGDVPPTPIRLADSAQPDELVAVIGYPARDSRIPDAALMDRIFGDVYDKKRLAPGQLLDPRRDAITHDCSTLGGNSGSVVLSLDTGDAVGLHFAGRFLEANFAVPSRVVAQRLEQLGQGGRTTPAPVVGGEVPQRTLPPTAPPASSQTSPTAQTPPSPASTLSLTIPLTVTVEIGQPVLPGAPAAAAVPPDPAPASPVAAPGGVVADDAATAFVETVAADYADREGYDASFLGGGFEVPLPTITEDVDDVLTFEFGGQTQEVLKYQHFSVLMGRSRKLCRWSAVNIDGNREVEGLSRPGWRTDPRIPPDAQIRDACYGNPPKFSRGHMTRREYPNWGTRTAAERANADSMHVTNVAPQMQTFNGGVWLQLEEYALQHARTDDMRICVFTGPIFADDDPVRFGVKIPVEFFKVIAFVHDETGELSATGYTMSQAGFLQAEEFVFGQHETAQRRISSIEALTGLSFGSLADLDPFDEPEGAAQRLTDTQQIQLTPRG